VYKLPQDFDGNDFVGQTLSEMTFTPNTVSFIFGPGLVITTLSVYSYRLAENEESRVEQVPMSCTKVLGLIGKVVMRVSIIDERNLRLTFIGGGELNYIDDSDAYESYSIKIGDRELTV
jgi:hypothetical protein